MMNNSYYTESFPCSIIHQWHKGNIKLATDHDADADHLDGIIASLVPRAH